MKYPQYSDLPAWHVWSDGRKFTPGEAKRFRKLWKRCRHPGEKPRPFFVRVRAVIEAEMAKRTVAPSQVESELVGASDDLDRLGGTPDHVEGVG